MKARNGFLFKRIHDGVIMGNEVILGIDYSTGKERVDMLEYYEEIKDPECIWHEDTNFQIKFTERQLRYMLNRVPDMVYYTNTLEDYDDMMGNVYFYVNYFNEGEITLIKEFGEIYDKEGNKL